MSVIRVSDSDVHDGLKAIVARAGEEYIYSPRLKDDLTTACVYVHQGKPDCIVGRFLAEAGVPISRLAEADRDSYGAGIAAEGLLRRLRVEGVIEITNAAISALQAAQGHQDDGIPWGVAVSDALQYLPVESN